MGICILKEDGFCERHQKIHKGRELELSQLESVEGEKYRSLWDGKLKNGPGFVQRAINFTKAAAHHIAAGLPLVDDEEYNRRLDICSACELCDKSFLLWRCQAMNCGCYLQEGKVAPGKARWED